MFSFIKKFFTKPVQVELSSTVADSKLELQHSDIFTHAPEITEAPLESTLPVKKPRKKRTFKPKADK